MEISKISSKGQVTIPKSIRELLQLDAGDRILFIEENGKAYLTKANLSAIYDYQKTIAQGADRKGVTDETFESNQEAEVKDAWLRRRDNAK